MSQTDELLNRNNAGLAVEIALLSSQEADVTFKYLRVWLTELTETGIEIFYQPYMSSRLIKLRAGLPNVQLPKEKHLTFDYRTPLADASTSSDEHHTLLIWISICALSSV